MTEHEHLTDATKHVLDGASIATAVGTLMQVLPAIAALFTIIWTAIRIYETKTIQKLIGKNKD
jgi:glycerol-3-phosphate acyltransferase PlsY